MSLKVKFIILNFLGEFDGEEDGEFDDEDGEDFIEEGEDFEDDDEDFSDEEDEEENAKPAKKPRH
jgi:hypothetical protein